MRDISYRCQCFQPSCAKSSALATKSFFNGGLPSGSTALASALQAAQQCEVAFCTLCGQWGGGGGGAGGGFGAGGGLGGGLGINVCPRSHSKSGKR